MIHDLCSTFSEALEAHN